MNNFETVRDMLSEELGIAPEKIALESKLVEDLGADSISMMVIVTAIQDKYNIEIPDEAVKNTKTVADMVDFLDKNA